MTFPCFRHIGQTSLALLLACSFLLPRAYAAGEADFSLLPSTNTPSVGQFFTVKVMLSVTEPVDTIRLYMDYPAGVLGAVAVSPGANLPSVSPGNGINNAKGSLSFGSFTLGGPVSGNILAALVTFKTLKSGSGNITLRSNSLALTDGNNLYSGGSVSVPFDTKGDAGVPVITPPGTPQTGGGEGGGVISSSHGTVTVFSSSHPDQDIWYSARDILFSWSISGEKPQEFWMKFDEIPQTDPAASTARDSYSPDLPSVTYSAKNDGVWYLHARAVYKGGDASDVIHIPVKIDSTAPQSLFVDVDRTRAIAGESVTVNFGARENVSGITYAVSINGGDYTDAVSPYEIKNIPIGDMLFAVRATDGAGNTAFANTRLRAYDPNAPFVKLFTLGKSFLEKPRNVLIFTVLLAAILVVFCGILFMFARALRKRKKVTMF